jgi:hypothetical protein
MSSTRFGLLASDALRETTYRLSKRRNRELKYRRCNTNKSSFLPNSTDWCVLTG